MSVDEHALSLLVGFKRKQRKAVDSDILKHFLKRKRLQ